MASVDRPSEITTCTSGLATHCAFSASTASATQAAAHIRASQVEIFVANFRAYFQQAPALSPTLPALLSVRYLSNESDRPGNAAAAGYVDADRHDRYKRGPTVLRRSSVNTSARCRFSTPIHAFASAEPKSSAQLSEVTGAAQLVVATLLLTARGRLSPLTPSRCVQFLQSVF